MTEQQSEQKRKLVGFDNFVRHNPRSDRFESRKFHHIEFYCGDATNTAARFSWGLGMPLVAKSDQSTGNLTYASYVLKSHDLVFTFTAPYSSKVSQQGSITPHPAFSPNEADQFFTKHGLGVKAVGILVTDAAKAYQASIENGSHHTMKPQVLVDAKTGTKLTIAEVKLYGDVVLRFVSPDADQPFKGVFLPNYEEVQSPSFTYGITKLDHAVGNVHNLLDTIDYISKFTGFHEFAEFVAEDVGTVDSGLNSMVLANNNEKILLPVNEPTFGTKRKSQIQTYLEQNEGEGLQHLALKTNDIFLTVREMRQRSHLGGFSFMPAPSDSYYRSLPKKIGNILTESQYAELEELGLLADKDDQGVLLQIFTKPLGDRPTIFIEIIQRIGCAIETDEFGDVDQKGGCGGFGKGNFSELFKSIEEYEKTLNV